MNSSQYRGAALTEGEAPSGGEDVRTSELKTTASIVAAHSENVTNSLKPHKASANTGKGNMGIQGHREG